MAIDEAKRIRETVATKTQDGRLMATPPDRTRGDPRLDRAEPRRLGTRSRSCASRSSGSPTGARSCAAPSAGPADRGGRRRLRAGGRRRRRSARLSVAAGAGRSGVSRGAGESPWKCGRADTRRRRRRTPSSSAASARARRLAQPQHYHEYPEPRRTTAMKAIVGMPTRAEDHAPSAGPRQRSQDSWRFAAAPARTPKRRARDAPAPSRPGPTWVPITGADLGDHSGIAAEDLAARAGQLRCLLGAWMCWTIHASAPSSGAERSSRPSARTPGARSAPARSA